jgi:hypothetical protein
MVCPFVEIGPPSPTSECVSPTTPWTQRGEQHSLAGEGPEGLYSDDWTESLWVSTFLGPKWHSAIGSMPFNRAQKSLDFQGPTPSYLPS